MFALIFVGVHLVTGCGSAKDESTPGLADQLSREEFENVCTAYNGKARELDLGGASCGYTAVISAIDAAQDEAPTDVDLRQICTRRQEECGLLAFPYEESCAARNTPEPCLMAPADLTACLTDRVAQLHALLASAPPCDELTRPGIQELARDDQHMPESCVAALEHCPGAFE